MTTKSNKISTWWERNRRSIFGRRRWISQKPGSPGLPIPPLPAVQDTKMSRWHSTGPLEAVKAFLAKHPEFQVRYKYDYWAWYDRYCFQLICTVSSWMTNLVFQMDHSRQLMYTHHACHGLPSTCELRTTRRVKTRPYGLGGDGIIFNSFCALYALKVLTPAWAQGIPTCPFVLNLKFWWSK